MRICQADFKNFQKKLGWGGRIRTYAMLESESNALPLGDTPSTMKADKINGVIEGGRTLDLQSHNLAFCQLNYDHHMVLPEGFEPSTSALEGHCSIQLSYGSKWSR